MASESVRRAFKERGIEAIPVPSGRRFFIDELRYGTRHDVEIVAGAGPWYTGATETSDDTPTSGDADPSLPLVRSAPRIDRKSTRLNSSHYCATRMPTSA